MMRTLQCILILVILTFKAQGQNKLVYIDTERAFKELKYDSLVSLDCNGLNQHLNDSLVLMATRITDEIKKHGTHYSEQKIKELDGDILDYVESSKQRIEKLRAMRTIELTNLLKGQFDVYCAANGLTNAGRNCSSCKDLTSDFIKYKRNQRTDFNDKLVLWPAHNSSYLQLRGLVLN